MGSANPQDWIGRMKEADDVLTPRLLASYRATFGQHLAPCDSEIAPLGMHWCLAPEIIEMSRLGEDGHPAMGDFLPSVPLPRRMWAGGKLTFFAPLRVNDHVRRRSTVESIVEKQGRSGPLCFVTVLHELENESGPAISERHVIVYREPRPLMSEPEPLKQLLLHSNPPAHEFRVDPVFLFRYSALTFNGHRIHYDAPYATETEGYGGLVIHGPVQATLLLNRAASITKRSLKDFSYKAVSPAVGCQTLSARATAIQDDRISLAIDSERGQVTMEATASW